MSNNQYPETPGHFARLAISAKTIMALLNMDTGLAHGISTGTEPLKLDVTIDPACSGLTNPNEFWLTYQSKEDMERLIAALDDFLAWSGVDVGSKHATALKKRFDGGYRLKSRGVIDVTKGLYIVTFKRHFYFKLSSELTQSLLGFIGKHVNYDFDIAA
ncbi:MAG: hypothetical protein ACOYMG_27915 [Candidatus Methylumidiphilus sp.]